MAEIVFYNRLVSLLAEDAAIDDETMTITDTTGWPTDFTGTETYATLRNAEGQSEVVLITGRTGEVINVSRGQQSTTAKVWSAGSIIQARPLAYALGLGLQKAVYRDMEGSPLGVVTPAYVGEKLFNLEGYWYMATGATSADWKVICGPPAARELGLHAFIETGYEGHCNFVSGGYVWACDAANHRFITLALNEARDALSPLDTGSVVANINDGSIPVSYSRDNGKLERINGYLTGQYRCVFDLTNPSDADPVSGVQVSIAGVGDFTSDGYYYTTSSGSSYTIYIYDAAYAYKGSLALGCQPEFSLTPDENYLIGFRNYGEGRTIDISTRESPVRYDWNLGTSGGMWKKPLIFGDYALCAYDDNTAVADDIHLIDISNPLAPAVLETGLYTDLDFAEPAGALYGWGPYRRVGDYALFTRMYYDATVGWFQIIVYDMSNPAYPRLHLFKHYDSPGDWASGPYVTGIDIDDTYVYYIDYNGLYVFE